MAKKYHLLIIDDEDAIRDMVQFSLEKFQFKIDGVADCQHAKQFLAGTMPDLILLDWMLPDDSGIEFAKKLRHADATKKIPIIMLTAKAEENNKIRGLAEAEVDDYVTKPFSPRELAARIQAVLRRAPPSSKIYQTRELQLDYEHRQVTIAGAPVELTAKQFHLLYFFVTHGDKVYTRAQLVDALANGNEFIDDRSVDRQVKRLRDVLQPFGYDQHLQTVRGHGYRWVNKI